MKTATIQRVVMCISVLLVLAGVLVKQNHWGNPRILMNCGIVGLAIYIVMVLFTRKKVSNN